MRGKRLGMLHYSLSVSWNLLLSVCGFYREISCRRWVTQLAIRTEFLSTPTDLFHLEIGARWIGHGARLGIPAKWILDTHGRCQVTQSVRAASSRHLTLSTPGNLYRRYSVVSSHEQYRKVLVSLIFTACEPRRLRNGETKLIKTRVLGFRIRLVMSGPHCQEKRVQTWRRLSWKGRN